MSSLRSLGRPVGRLARRGWQGPHVPGWTRSIATTPQSRFAEEEPKKRGFFATLKAEVEKEMEKDEEMKKNLETLKEKSGGLSETMKKVQESDIGKVAKDYSGKASEASEAAGSLKGKVFGMFGSKAASAEKEGETHAKEAEPSREAASQPTEGAPKSRQPSEAEPTSQPKGASGAKKAAAEERVEESKGPVTAFVDFLKTVKTELIDTTARRSDPYEQPADRRRARVEGERLATQVEENTEEQGVVLSKGSEWASQWANFKDNNPLVNRLFELKMRYDESDNIAVRMTRTVTDTLSERLGGAFESGEMAQTLAEIARIDPSFDKEEFLIHCERKVIPAFLEAYMLGDLETLKDWCAPNSYSLFEHQLTEFKEAGYRNESRIMDLRNADIIAAQIMEGDPVLVMQFETQQITCIRDGVGAIVEGGDETIEKVFYVFAMRRDQSVYDPRLAWQVLEMSAMHRNESW